MKEAVYPSLAGARRFAQPLPNLWHPASLSDEDIRAYWRFRALFMNLKPHVRPEDDWSSFSKWVRQSDFVYFGLAPDGRLVAAVSHRIELREHQGRPVVLLWPEYGYTLPEAKKSTGFGFSFLLAGALAALRYPGIPRYVVGTSYLSSFTALGATVKTRWLYDEPSMPPWEQSIWRSLAEATPGYDPQRKIVCMKTIPRNPRTTPPSRSMNRSAWEHYLAHNPQWTEGYTCLIMIPFGFMEMAPAALRMFTSR